MKTYFKINIFNIISVNPLRIPHCGNSGLYKVSEKTPEDALADIIIPRNGVTQVVYLDENMNPISTIE